MKNTIMSIIDAGEIIIAFGISLFIMGLSMGSF